MELVWPAAQYLPAYIFALQQSWSPDDLRPEAATDHLERELSNALMELADGCQGASGRSHQTFYEATRSSR